MSVSTKNPNHFPKDIFHNIKNQDVKFKALSIEINQTDDLHNNSKEIAKIQFLKHEFKTPAIVHSHKLPKAFNYISINKLENEKRQDDKIIEQNLATKDKFDELDIKKNILNMEKKKKCSIEITKNSQEKIDKKPLKIIKNPIAPLRNFFKIAKQNENEFSQESTTVRLIESRCNKLEIKKIINNEGKFQMNEMITVSIINSSNNTNQIKIILHIPSLKTFVIREESLMNIENFHARKKMLTIWQNNLNLSNNFLQIHELFWNYPEGYTSILCEIMRGGSLKDLLEYIGCLNETLLKSLSSFLLKAYKEFFSITNHSLGTISLSQILFDDQGNIKIGPKLSQNFTSPKINHFNKWRSLFSKLRRINDINNTSNNDDLFEIGLILLFSAVGDIELFDQNACSGDMKKISEEPKDTVFLKSDSNFFLNDRKKEIMKNAEVHVDFDQDTLGNSCCLLHLIWECCEEKKLAEYIKKRHSSNFFKILSRKNGLLMKKIIETRFSKEFIDFLCCCLRFNPKNRSNIENLLMHSFFLKNNHVSNEVSVKEIVRISSNWNLNQSSYAIKDKIGQIVQSIFIILEEKNIKKSKFFEGKNMERLINELVASLGMSNSAISEIIRAQIKDL